MKRLSDVQIADFLETTERKSESQRRDLNPRPADYESAALPTELRWLPGFAKVPRN